MGSWVLDSSFLFSVSKSGKNEEKGRVFKCQSNFKRIFVDLRDTEREEEEKEEEEEEEIDKRVTQKERHEE